eukprot:GDKK01033736.1.p1 GENE.GDKK01033736.1~~GDKK01033736.1.p1  ORF type:complete len:465 (-),score=129.18 GDKK01033736.1:241-1557(-)
MEAREEWIPGVSSGKKKLRIDEVLSHLDLGKTMHTDGNTEFSNGNYDMALLRYAQGVELLKWVEGPSNELTFQLQNMLLVFFKNQAQAALRVGKWSEALDAADNALKMTNQRDPKALFRKGEALQLLGRTEAARATFLQLLTLANETKPMKEKDIAISASSDAQCDESTCASSTTLSVTSISALYENELSAEQKLEAKRAAKIGLDRIAVAVKAEKEKAKQMVAGMNGIFSRKSATTNRDSSQQTANEQHDASSSNKENCKNENCNLSTNTHKPNQIFSKNSTINALIQKEKQQQQQQHNSSPASTSASSSKSTSSPSHISQNATLSPPRMNLAECKEMMDALEEHYASAGFQFVMRQHRDLADYDERRILIRARKALPDLIAPVIKEFGFNCEDKVQAATECQKTIDYYRSKDKHVQSAAGRLLKLVLGDALNLDME